jgi:uncharacterized membrane protein HdeD (DUF308 family)
MIPHILKNTVMKLFQISFGLLGIAALITGLVILFNQPFQTAATNDAAFFGVFMAGLFCTSIFLLVGSFDERRAAKLYNDLYERPE